MVAEPLEDRKEAVGGQAQGEPIAQDDHSAASGAPASNEVEPEQGPQVDSRSGFEDCNEHGNRECLDVVPMDELPFHDADLSVAQPLKYASSQPKSLSFNSSDMDQSHRDEPAPGMDANPSHPSVPPSSLSSPPLPSSSDLGSSFVTRRRRRPVTAPPSSDQPSALPPAVRQTVTDPLASDPALPTPSPPPPAPANDLFDAPTQVGPGLLTVTVEPVATGGNLVQEAAVAEPIVTQALGIPTATPAPQPSPRPSKPRQSASTTASQLTTELVVEGSTTLVNADADASSDGQLGIPVTQPQPQPVGGLPEEAHVADLFELVDTEREPMVKAVDRTPVPQLPEYDDEQLSSPSISADSSDWSYATQPEVCSGIFLLCR